MLTTVTIDPDTEELLREEMRRTGLSFAEVLNQSVRQGILRQPASRPRITVEPLFPAPFPAEFDGKNLSKLADELDDQQTLRELGR